jgi:hypothetical protein
MKLTLSFSTVFGQIEERRAGKDFERSERQVSSIARSPSLSSAYASSMFPDLFSPSESRQHEIVLIEHPDQLPESLRLACSRVLPLSSTPPPLPPIIRTLLSPSYDSNPSSINPIHAQIPRIPLFRPIISPSPIATTSLPIIAPVSFTNPGSSMLDPTLPSFKPPSGSPPLGSSTPLNPFSPLFIKPVDRSLTAEDATFPSSSNFDVEYDRDFSVHDDSAISAFSYRPSTPEASSPLAVSKTLISFDDHDDEHTPLSAPCPPRSIDYAFSRISLDLNAPSFGLSPHRLR